MDETRDHVRAIPRRHFPAHAEDADRPAARVVHRVGHWFAGLVAVQENRFPVDRLLRGHHVHGRTAGHILGNVDSSRENDEQGRTTVDRAPREQADHHIRHHIRLNQVRSLLSFTLKSNDSVRIIFEKYVFTHIIYIYT